MRDIDLILNASRWMSLVPYPQIKIILVLEPSVLWPLPNLCTKMCQWLDPFVPHQVVEIRKRVTALPGLSHHPVGCTLHPLVAHHLTSRHQFEYRLVVAF